jgi:deoxycytidylate deaminase
VVSNATSTVVEASEPTTSRPELVFGLVGALGTELVQVQRELQSALRSAGYTSSTIRLSELITDVYEHWSQRTAESDDTKMGALMRQGDELRAAAGTNAVVALGISRIQSERRGTNPGVEERHGHATILRSLKRKDEVATLREVYGPRFVLIGGWATRQDRRSAVEDRLRADHPGNEAAWYAAQTARLMERDEDDETRPYGQGVREAFELADFYVAIRAGRPTEPRISRLIRLLFGSPFETPTREEQAMFLASGASMRSSAAGRQVGVVVTDSDGEVLVTGTNDVPKAGGGQYWPDDIPDHRDFNYGYDVNDRLRLEIVADVLSRLHAAGWLSEQTMAGDKDKLAEAAMGGPLRGSRIGDLLEFGRIAHAEMAAICTAARRGTALRGTTMYSTTYPCHECTRLIIAAGLQKVVYVDPYPKSQVQTMFKDEVSEGPGGRPDTISFEPFEGVAPRLYRNLFLATPRRRNKVTGQFDAWDSSGSALRLLATHPAPPPMKALEDSVISELGRRL